VVELVAIEMSATGRWSQVYTRSSRAVSLDSFFRRVQTTQLSKVDQASGRVSSDFDRIQWFGFQVYENSAEEENS